MKFNYVCPICGEIELNSDDYYQASTNSYPYIPTIFPAKVFDAYDCPVCKCQIRMTERLQKIPTYPIFSTSHCNPNDEDMKER